MVLAVYLTILLTFATLSAADDRMPYYALADLTVGALRRHGGGATSYNLTRQIHDKIWMDAEESRSYHTSQTALAREGYNPGRAFREDTVVWSYNCQMANPTRIREWSREFQHHMVLMQGTQRTYDQTIGEKH